VTPLQWLDGLQGSGIRPGLSRIRSLLRELKHPERAYRSIIVAGTNGKGSTSAMIESIVRASGVRTAFYTSPHLVDIRERWMIGGSVIERGLLDRSIDELRSAADRAGIVPTYFEALTIIAFIAFARAGCELAVLEVGMGGRLDATNVVKPIASVITPIGLDHQEYLGDTIAKIAFEKAGVIHRSAVVLTSNEDERVLRVLRRRAEKFGDPFIVVRDDHDTPLAGAFQRRNAALAVATARALGIDERAIEEGVKNTRWRGRLECLRLGGKEIWIDGGHNPHAVGQTAPFIDANIPRPRLLVFGIMSDKDVKAVTDTLFPLFDRIITTEPFPPRSVRADSFPGAIPIADPDEAFRAALASGERSIVVTGSLYLAGAALRFFDKIAA
jgi:dihydrofolate synthase/folylpolyglutamate synthase